MSKLRQISRSIQRFSKGRRWPRTLTLNYYLSPITSLLKLFVAGSEKQRIKDLVLGVPALLGFIAFLVLAGRAQSMAGGLSVKYFDNASKAYIAKDYNQAELLLTRVIQRNEAKVGEAQYLMAELLNQEGQTARASQLFELLAPETRRGNPNAHRRLAVLLSEAISSESSSNDIKRLAWHLKCANRQESPSMQMASGRYALLTGDLAAARDHFRAAVEEYPLLWQALGEIEMRLGNQESASLSFNYASENLENKLKKDPLNSQIRINYAVTLSKLGRLDEARATLEKGKSIDEEGPWGELLANLAVNFHDLKSAQGESISVLLGYLRHALKQDPNHGMALNRLMGYAKADVSGNGDLKTILESVIAEGEQPALAHLAMGNLNWLEGDQKTAVFHFEQAASLRKDISVTLNNLAWMLAHDPESPDPDRALALVDSALEQSPDDPRFLDTRGAVLIVKKEWKKAITDLEKALSRTTGNDKKPIHKRLATAYSAIEMEGMADQHRRLAE